MSHASSIPIRWATRVQVERPMVPRLERWIVFALKLDAWEQIGKPHSTARYARLAARHELGKGALRCVVFHVHEPGEEA